MFTPLKGKIVTVIGSSGYVGSTIMNYAWQYGALVNGISRRGKTQIKKQWEKEVNWIIGDAMNPNSFSDTIRNSDLVIHTIGTLLDTTVTSNKKPGEPGTYEQMNRDTAIHIAETLKGSKAQMVYLSGSSHPPFLERYLTTKQEAEKYLLDMHEKGELQPIILRPGFIYSWEHRWWSVPLVAELGFWRCAHQGLSKVIPQNSGATKLLNQFKVDTSINLQDVVDSSLAPLSKDLVGRILLNPDMEEEASCFRRLKQ